MLDAWWDYGTGVKSTCKDRWFRVQQRGHNMNLDNPWMWHAMINVMDKHTNTRSACWDQCLDNTIAKCFREHFRNLSYPIAHTPEKLEWLREHDRLSGKLGPILFSE